MTLYVVAALVTLVVAYVFILRPILRDLPLLDPLFDRIESFELMLWAKSRTVLVARLAWVPSVLLLLHDTAGAWALDLTPLLVRLTAGLPDDLRPLLLTAVTGLYGLVVEWLRRVTIEPLAEKE